MQIKMNELLSFQNFYEKIKNKSLPIKTSYKFMKFFNEVNKELKFYQEQLIKISEEFGERDKNGELISTEEGGVKIKKEELSNCQSKINELLNLDIEIDNIIFSLDELENLNLSLSDLQIIEKFICE